MASSGSMSMFNPALLVGEMIELEDLFVDPKWMRRGVGLKLVLDAAAIAKEQSFDRLEVTANPHAQEFYEIAGFVADHVVKTEFYPSLGPR